MRVRSSLAPLIMPYKNPKQQNEYQRLWRAKRRKDWFDANGPCVKCGSFTDLELDHIDESTKVTHGVWSWSEKRRSEELAKCQILCKKCHLEKTKKYLHKLKSGGSNPTHRSPSKSLIKKWKTLRAKGLTYRFIGEMYGFPHTTVLYNLKKIS
jgi:5-methylcytosine-specific restriction endonuclease McrA